MTRRDSPRAGRRSRSRASGDGRAALVRDAEGQASVELVALAPILVALVLALAQLLAAGSARELADHAAEAGAVALLQGTDPAVAVRDAVPGWSRGRMDVRIVERRVEVRLRPRTFVPGMAAMLEATGHADAGPRP